MKRNTEIIILAGGKGTRMESDNPKALTLLDGKPFIEHILETLKNIESPHNTPIVVVGYKKEMIMDSLNSGVLFAIQEEQLGTGHAVSVAEQLILEKENPVLVLYADHPLISSTTIDLLIQKQEETKSPIVMATTEVPHFEDWYNAFIKWGRIVRNSIGDITQIIEYKDANENERTITEVNPAYAVYDGKWLLSHLQYLSNNNNQKEYYLTDLVKMAFDEGFSIPSVSIPPRDALGANSVYELEILKKLYFDRKV